MSMWYAIGCSRFADSMYLIYFCFVCTLGDKRAVHVAQLIEMVFLAPLTSPVRVCGWKNIRWYSPLARMSSVLYAVSSIALTEVVAVKESEGLSNKTSFCMVQTSGIDAPIFLLFGCVTVGILACPCQIALVALKVSFGILLLLLEWMPHVVYQSYTPASSHA